jgi:DNA-binding NarL/FixJ family response regulator
MPNQGYAIPFPMTPQIARMAVASFQMVEPGLEEVPHRSPREAPVLQYLAKGLTCTQIADQLDINLVTVRTYFRRIYEKLHVRSGTEAVAT